LAVRGPPSQPFTPQQASPSAEAEQESRSAFSARPDRPFGVQTSPEND
jgi:hypothetical protein